MPQLAEIDQKRETRQAPAWPFTSPQAGALGSTVSASTSIFGVMMTIPGGYAATEMGPTILGLTPSHPNSNYSLTPPSTGASSPSRQSQGGTQPRGRTTGPVLVLKKIVQDWNLSRHEVAELLAYINPQLAENVLTGLMTLRQPDREDRLRVLYQIYRVLTSLFSNTQDQRRWLRTPNPLLNDRRPLDVMIADRIPGMIVVKNLVDRLAGR